MVIARRGIGLFLVLCLPMSGCVDKSLEEPLLMKQQLPNNHNLVIEAARIHDGMVETTISIDGNLGSVIPIDAYDLESLKDAIQERSQFIENPDPEKVLVINPEFGLLLSKAGVTYAPHELNSHITYILDARPGSDYVRVSYDGDDSYVLRGSGSVEETIKEIFNQEEFRLVIRGPKSETEFGVKKKPILSGSGTSELDGIPVVIGEGDRAISEPSLDMESLVVRGRYADKGEDANIQMTASGAEWVKRLVDEGQIYVQIIPKSVVGKTLNLGSLVMSKAEYGRAKYLEGGPWAAVEYKNPNRIFRYAIEYRKGTGDDEYEVSVNGNYGMSARMTKVQLDNLIYARENGHFMTNTKVGRPGALLCYEKGVILTSEYARCPNPITYVFTGSMTSVKVPILSDVFTWDCGSEKFFPYIMHQSFELVFVPPDPVKDNVLIIRKADERELVYCALMVNGTRICGLKFPELVPKERLMILYKYRGTEPEKVEGSQGSVYMPCSNYEPLKFHVTDETVNLLRYCMRGDDWIVSNQLDIFQRQAAQPLSPNTKIYEERAPSEDDPDLHKWKYESSSIDGITIMHRMLHPLEISSRSNYDGWGRRLKGSGDFEVVVNGNAVSAFRCSKKKRDDVSHANMFGIPAIPENKNDRIGVHGGIVDLSSHIMITPEAVTKFSRVIVELDPLGVDRKGFVPSIIFIHRDSPQLLQIAQPIGVFKALDTAAQSGPVKITFRDIDEENPKSRPIVIKRNTIDDVFDVHGGPMIKFQEEGEKDAEPSYRESNHLGGIVINKDAGTVDGKYKYDPTLVFKKTIHPNSIKALEYLLSIDRLKKKLPVVIVSDEKSTDSQN